MRSKQWHRDRIEQLKLERSWYIEIQKTVAAAILATGALFLAMLAIYFPKKENYIDQILIGAMLVLIFIIILVVIDSFAKYKTSKFNELINRNYCVLLEKKN